MTDTDTVITEFVPKNLFDLHLQNIREKASSEEKFNNARFSSLEKSIDERLNTFQAIMEKNLGEYRAIANDMNLRIKALGETTNSTRTLFNEKIEHVIDTLTVAIRNNTDAINELKDDFKHQQTVLLTKVGIIVAVIVGVAQIVLPMFLK